MIDLKSILLAEDNPKDVELTIEALSEYNLANYVKVVKDGVEALEYLRCEGQHKDRNKSLPAVMLLDIKMPRMDGIEVLEVIRAGVRGSRCFSVVMLDLIARGTRSEEVLCARCQRLRGQTRRLQGVSGCSQNYRRFVDIIE